MQSQAEYLRSVAMTLFSLHQTTITDATVLKLRQERLLAAGYSDKDAASLLSLVGGSGPIRRDIANPTGDPNFPTNVPSYPQYAKGGDGSGALRFHSENAVAQAALEKAGSFWRYIVAFCRAFSDTKNLATHTVLPPQDHHHALIELGKSGLPALDQLETEYLVYFARWIELWSSQGVNTANLASFVVVTSEATPLERVAALMAASLPIPTPYDRMRFTHGALQGMDYVLEQATAYPCIPSPWNTPGLRPFQGHAVQASIGIPIFGANVEEITHGRIHPDIIETGALAIATPGVPDVLKIFLANITAHSPVPWVRIFSESGPPENPVVQNTPLPNPGSCVGTHRKIWDAPEATGPDRDDTRNQLAEKRDFLSAAPCDRRHFGRNK